jgi:hypothetical protein
VSVAGDDQMSIDPCYPAALEGLLFELLVGGGRADGNVALGHDGRLDRAEKDLCNARASLRRRGRSKLPPPYGRSRQHG